MLYMDRVEEITVEQAKKQFDVNLFGLAEVTKAIIPTMRNQKSGIILNISSVGGKIYSVRSMVSCYKART